MKLSCWFSYFNRKLRRDPEDWGDPGHDLLLPVLLERTHEGRLVLWSLEATMSELRAGIDELEIDLLQISLLGVGQQGLPKQ